MSTFKLDTDETVETNDSKAIRAIKELSIVTIRVTGPMECSGIRYNIGDEVTMSRDEANYHSENGNCTIVK